MRTVEILYKVLRRGAFLGYLSVPADGAPTLRMDAAAEIKTALSGTFGTWVTDADGNPVDPDWLSDEISPLLVIDGAEHPLGVFGVSNNTPTEQAGAESLQIEAFDRAWYVRDTKAETRVFFAAGTNYVSAVETLLTASGISTALATPTAAALSEDREWAIGTNYLQIVNELLGEINYASLHFSPEGFAVIEPVLEPTAANLRHTLSDRPDDLSSGAARVDALLPAISRSTDVYNAPNVFVVVCANPDKTANMVAVAENMNPQSPLSIPRRARRIVQVTQLNNIASLAALQAYADRQRDASLIGGEIVSVTTALQPGYGVDDVVGLHYKDLGGLCVLKGYTMELRAGGAMQMTLERVVYNLD